MAREQRRLAAILAADVVGYSRLMGRDESNTLARLREHRKLRFEPTLARHGGRLVKLIGDGALVEFASAVDALGAAIAFQQAMAEANRDQPEDIAVVFRIGLHLGDLIVDGDDLYGDAVNIAARLEAKAPVGGILISRNVYDAVAGRLKATFEDLGSLSLKNIERPIQVFRVGWEPADWEVSSPSVAPPPSVSSEPSLPLEIPALGSLPYMNLATHVERGVTSKRTNVQMAAEVKNTNDFLIEYRARLVGQVNGMVSEPIEFEGFVPANQTRQLVLAMTNVPVNEAPEFGKPVLAGALTYDVTYWAASASTGQKRRTSRTCAFEVKRPFTTKSEMPGEVKVSTLETTILLSNEVEE